MLQDVVSGALAHILEKRGIDQKELARRIPEPYPTALARVRRLLAGENVTLGLLGSVLDAAGIPASELFSWQPEARAPSPILGDSGTLQRLTPAPTLAISREWFIGGGRDWEEYHGLCRKRGVRPLPFVALLGWAQGRDPGLVTMWPDGVRLPVFKDIKGPGMLLTEAYDAYVAWLADRDIVRPLRRKDFRREAARIRLFFARKREGFRTAKTCILPDPEPGARACGNCAHAVRWPGSGPIPVVVCAPQGLYTDRWKVCGAFSRREGPMVVDDVAGGAPGQLGLGLAP
jgi:transcriptional regulator with XRE-family HTH domain